MSSRWFFSWARVGAAGAAAEPVIRTSVTFTRDVAGASTAVPIPGPGLVPAGPGDVAGFDPALVLRQEPSPGAVAAENILASVDFAHADLPWLLSTSHVTPASGPVPVPWLVLVVLADDEAGAPRPGSPLPVLTAPVAALPPLADRWAWAHVEARLDDGVTDAVTAARLAANGVRTRSAAVVGRLLCPRRLAPERGWIACVVPATAAGRDAGLNRDLAGPPGADAWTAGGGGTVDLPVYHWWRFRTGAAGSFEDLARRLVFRPAAGAGFGTRTVDVTRPWPDGDGDEPATGTVSVEIDGALRVPGPPTAERWSDPVAQERFRARLRDRLAGPARQVDPPLYGGHHTGARAVPDGESWLATLNLEVRRRVAAALGARYVQVEQEFLMARAWEQVGEVRAANRLLATTELAAAAAEQGRRKFLDALDVDDLLRTMAPAANRLLLPAEATGRSQRSATLATALAAATVPNGAATTAFARLTRRGGRLARRFAATDGGDAPLSVIRQGLVDGGMATGADSAGLRAEVTGTVSSLRLHLNRIGDRIPVDLVAARDPGEARPLRPMMAHPRFAVPIAEEILARWPEWAVPGIGGLAENSVTLLETNPEFVAALLVGANEEVNRELLWREFPTDQRGTPFDRFWPTDGADIDEIARWPVDAPLGAQVRGGAEGSLALLVRADLIRRFPGTAVLAVRGENGELPKTFAGIPATPLVLDESTVLYLFAGIDEHRARSEGWFFVFREPMRGTQFGFDLERTGPLSTWADLSWHDVEVDGARFIRLAPAPPQPSRLPPDDPAGWGRDPADLARIAFQQPFQLAFAAAALLGG